MATRITHFLHSSVVTGAQSLGTGFTTTNAHLHDLSSGQSPIINQNRNWYGILEGIFITLASASSPTATKVTIRVCLDAAGDEILIPDTEATLVAGVTTATQQCAAFSVKLPLFQRLAFPGNGNLYVFAKVDNAGTAPVMAQTTLAWSE